MEYFFYSGLYKFVTSQLRAALGNSNYSAPDSILSPGL
jgi:hypothetical protein